MTVAVSLILSAGCSRPGHSTKSADDGASVTAIDRSAPAIAEAEVVIGADAGIVWELMTGVESWPDWNPGVKSASLEGPLAEGTEFRWKAGPGTITSRIELVERQRRLVWTGKTLGIRAIHVWRLEPRGDTTVVATEESWGGLVARVFRTPMQKTLKKSIDDGLEHLKAEAERKVGTPE